MVDEAMKAMMTFKHDRDRELRELRKDVKEAEAALGVAKMKLAVVEGARFIVMPAEGDERAMVFFDPRTPMFMRERVRLIIEDCGRGKKP